MNIDAIQGFGYEALVAGSVLVCYVMARWSAWWWAEFPLSDPVDTILQGAFFGLLVVLVFT